MQPDAAGHLEVPVPLAATLFALNLRTWRTDPTVHGIQPDIDRLAHHLDELRQADTDRVVTWSMRQLAVRRREVPTGP